MVDAQRPLIIRSVRNMSTQVHSTDVVIVGAGPVGLFAVFECGMLGLRCHVVDALDMIGGQCTALYPDKPIYDIPALPVVAASDLIDRLEEQARPFAPAYHLGQRVEELSHADDGRWRVLTSTGTAIECAAVVIAAGVGAFGPNRPPLEGIENYEGRGVLYAVRRAADLAGKRVVIAGGGDSAVDWAIVLAKTTASVTVVHRRDRFRAAPGSVARMQALVRSGRIDLVVPYQLAGLEGQNGVLEAVDVASLDGDRKRLPADILLPFFGLSMNIGPIASWGVELVRNHVAVDPATCATNVDGLFAIGDIATYPGKLKLILSGFAEAATAAHAVYGIARPDEPLHFEYSTTKGVPGR